MLNKNVLLVLIVLFIGSFAWAQDFGFGFGEDNDSQSAASSGSAPSVNVSGEVSAAIIGYIDEMSEGAEHINTRDMFMFSGRLNFFAQSNFAEGIINLKLVPALVPVSIDEAYIRAFFGNLEFTAGLRKIAWGKADQFGPLDVINMPDQSRIFVEMADNTSLMGIKIATPVIHASYRFGQFSKLEGIFLPSFEIISTAITTAVSPPDPLMMAIIGPASGDRWMPDQMKMLGAILQNGSELIMPDTSGLDYAQAGMRFTTSLGSADVGLQYFYGRMFQPAAKITYDFLTNPAMPTIESIEFSFNNYHQIGLDYAQVLGGFSIRAEVAANITEDLKGDDGYVYNPSVGWSFGFDRDIIAGLNINIQANGSVRLFDDKVGSDNPFASNFDIEGGKSMTSTRLTAMLSKKFLRDQLELRTAVVWGIEDEDAAIIPALIWTRDELRLALSGGFFLGNSEGQIGQYSGNNFLKISVTYVF
ncbi:MAG: hypothetical protein FWC01_07215 [Treponema sp.]|nr:hypothetical protein [Treponema sp.]MCL2238059.1 hypothetical protein [Treponema sp.]